jgi:hypothetical protein
VKVSVKDSTGQVKIPYRFVTMSASLYHNNTKHYPFLDISDIDHILTAGSTPIFR